MRGSADRNIMLGNVLDNSYKGGFNQIRIDINGESAECE